MYTGSGWLDAIRGIGYDAQATIPCAATAASLIFRRHHRTPETRVPA